MIRSHRIALDPTVAQGLALSRACGVARFTWNWGLAEWKRQYEAGGKPTANSLKLTWNKIKMDLFPWVSESPKDANQQPFANLGKAFKKFFRGEARYPKFKKRGIHDSFYVSNDKFSIDGDVVRLPIIGHVRMREALRFEGKIMSGTVSREADRWFLSVSVDTQASMAPDSEKSIGIDLGITVAVMCSDGSAFEAPKPLKRKLRHLKRRSRQHSRKQKGSNNRKKSQRRLARLHVRIKRIRQDWTHKVTSKLINENQVICIEDLNVKGMMANQKLSRSIQDMGFFEIRRQLQYKAELYGRTIAVIDRWTPSSKTCSCCGTVKDSIALSERVFHCPSCGLEIDRDLNAAKVIHTVGLTGIYACGPEGSGSALADRTKPRRDEAGTKTRGHSRVLTT